MATPKVPSGPKPDQKTKDAIAQGDQSIANQTALANATAKNMDAQAALEYMKSMHEMNAKSVKSSGEALKGLA